MQSVTREYLTTLLFKKISVNIDLYRESKHQQFDNVPYPGATDEELLDFILTIPYFDNKLKDFLLGNLKEHTIIISQPWENEFIKKILLWVDSQEWLHGHYAAQPAPAERNAGAYGYLTLPY